MSSKMVIFNKKIEIYLLLLFIIFTPLFGGNSKYTFGTGLGLEYGGVGLQVSKDIDQNSNIFISAIPVQPYINAIGISSDLYFLQETNIRTHITYGTTGFRYSSNGFYSVCKSNIDDCNKEDGYVEHSLGVSIGINYFFNQPYKGWHFGLDYVLFHSTYFYDWKNVGFSKWKKENDHENIFGSIVWSLGYKF